MTGMRQGELNALQVKNVDFINKEIKIEHSWSRLEKRLKGTKTKPKMGYRVLPFSDLLGDILRPLVERYTSEEDRIFGWDDANYTYRLYSEILKTIGTRFSGHITRHTFITNAYELGFPPYLIKFWVGHAEIEQADAYLALRKASDYVDIEITEYMKLLKSETVIKT